MFSVRVAARAAPRSVCRIAAAAVRSSIRPVAFQAFKPAAQQLAAFSNAAVRMAKEGEVDEELAAKLMSEVQIESDMKVDEEVPLSIEEFLKNSMWEVQDTPGQEEVVLTRQFGDENIRVTFTIADLENIDAENDDFAERGLGDEDDTNINAGSEQLKAAPEDQIEEDEDLDTELPEGFPARLNVVISKKGSKGGLRVETIAQDGAIIIENVYYYDSAADADAQTAEVEHKTARMYAGPPFMNLDVDLQVLLERYLDERGINTTLALFVPDYIDWKEQREYLRWLENLKGFIEA